MRDTERAGPIWPSHSNELDAGLRTIKRNKEQTKESSTYVQGD